MEHDLDDIVEKRKEQLQREKDNIEPQDMKEMALNSKNKNHGFKEALKKSGLSVISEVKKASPSKGVIAEDFRPVETAIAYEDAGAAAISCLTEEHYFKGGSKYFADIRAKVDIPMLRKDFIFDEYQIYEAKVLGADAILLIAAILSEEKIKEFYDLAKSLEIDCLVEVHNEKELKKVVACGCDIIGINNRNLKTFDVDLNTTSKLAPLIPYEAVLVSESGMKDENDMKNVKEQGADAVLIGETFTEIRLHQRNNETVTELPMIQNQIKEQSLKVKMCGMRRKEDIAYANEVKPDAIGYIFFSKSKRYVTGQQARELDQNLDQKILSVGVFVNETIEKVTEIANEVPLDVIQLHGDEDVIYIEQLRQQTDKEIWKAVRVKDTKDIKEAQQLPVDKLLLDTFTEGKDMYGGTGKVMNYDLIPKEGIRKPFFIAGGLHSKNIKEITEKVHPYGIDISSGIETDGYKDLKKMKEIMQITGGRHE